ncbi:MAG TPA: helix-turn-helix domain-containing protein [Microlunatus sp.]
MKTRHTLTSIDGRLTVRPWSDDDSEPSAGRLLGIGKRQTYAAMRSGQIPSVRIGGRLVVPVAGLRRMLGMDDAA